MSEGGFTSELLDGLDVAASYSYRQESGPRERRNFHSFPSRAPEEFGITTDATVGRHELVACPGAISTTRSVTLHSKSSYFRILILVLILVALKIIDIFENHVGICFMGSFAEMSHYRMPFLSREKKDIFVE